jgi:putative endonuclease
MFEWLSKIIKRRTPGERGERLAARWLGRERGFSLIARNWRNPRDRREEIDLVARDGEVLVFVEVKLRAAEAVVSGYFAVDERKRDVMRRAIQAYLAGLRVKPVTVRFDIVEIAMPAEGEPEIHHYANVKLFPPRWRPREPRRTEDEGRETGG